jgi:hypothetical protein
MRPGPLHKIEVVCMKAEQLAIHSLSTAHRNLEEALDAYSAAGFRYVEPYLPLVRAWIEDGHTVDETRELFDARDLQLIASSELAVECFHASDVLLPNLRANADLVVESCIASLHSGTKEPFESPRAQTCTGEASR